MMDLDLLAENLAARGIRRVFGIPGSGATLSLIDALEKRNVAFHLTRFEGTGVLMAGTAGRLSGRAGVSLSIKGPGLANAVPGLAATWFEAFPVVHLTEAYPPSAPAYLAHKRLDQAHLVKSVRKGILNLSDAGPGAEGAFSLAEAEEPGPVVLELLDAGESRPMRPASQSPNVGTGPVIEMIQRSKRPVVIAGALAVRQGWGGRLNELNIPVFSTVAAKGVVNEALPHSAGVYTGVGAELAPEFQLLPKADLVICLGLTAREVLATKPFPCDSVSVCAVHPPGHEGFAFSHSAGMEALKDILDALSDRSWGLDELQGIRERLNSSMTRDFLPGQVFQLINRHFNGNARAVMDTGYFCTIGEHAWRATSPALCLMSGQGRYMGTGLPMALGASLHDPSIPTIAFLGDGGAGMYLAEAALAARNKLPLLVVVLSDNAFASIRTRAIRDGLTQTPLIMDGRSWVDSFGALGLPGARADTLKGVNESVLSWNPDNGPAFLEIAFDADAYESMVQGIR